MKIYQIDSSARKEGSTSRALAKKLLDKIKKPEDFGDKWSDNLDYEDKKIIKNYLFINKTIRNSTASYLSC